MFVFIQRVHLLKLCLLTFVTFHCVFLCHFSTYCPSYLCYPIFHHDILIIPLSFPFLPFISFSLVIPNPVSSPASNIFPIFYTSSCNDFFSYASPFLYFSHAALFPIAHQTSFFLLHLINPVYTPFPLLTISFLRLSLSSIQYYCYISFQLPFFQPIFHSPSTFHCSMTFSPSSPFHTPFPPSFPFTPTILPLARYIQLRP